MRQMKNSGIPGLEQLPSNWIVVPLKSRFSFGKGLSITKADLAENGIPVLSYGQVHSKKNNRTSISESLLRFVPEWKTLSSSDSLAVRNGFIFADTSEDRDGCGNCNYVDRDGLFAGYHTIVLKPTTSDNWKYLAYLFQTDAWRYQFRRDLIEVKVYSVSQSTLKSAYIPIPPPEEREAIVQFLDARCAEIDALEADIQKEIETLQEYRRSLITEVVTKGLDSDAEMKDSDIDWIDSIPLNWQTQRIKTLFRLREERNTLPLEKVNLISLYTDLGVIQHSDLEKTSGNKAFTADGYKIVRKNDIVVNIILCWMGAIGRSSYSGVTSPAYDVYIPSERVESRFYHYYFRTKGFNGDCYKRGKGIMAMRWRTYSDDFRDIRVVFPPLDEQRRIADFLDDKCTEIDSIIETKQKQIETLSEYRKSLIYEYVTGKKEVI